MSDQNQTPKNDLEALSAAFIEPLAEIGAQVYRAMTDFAESLQKALSDFVPVFIEAAKPIVEVVWQTYQSAGSPYGDTQEGLLQWLSEENEAARIQAEAEAEQERERQWVVEDFRRQLAEKLQSTDG